MSFLNDQQFMGGTIDRGESQGSFQTWSTRPSGISLVAPARRFDVDSPELIDRLDLDSGLLREELEVLEKWNERFGGHALVLQYVSALLQDSGSASVTILDLATGGADIPRAIASWARKRGKQVEIVAVDRNPNVVRLAQEWCRDWPEINVEQRDVRDLAYAEGSFDLVLCSLALHHFSSADVLRILRRMQQMARIGYIANDLRRNWMAILIAEVLSRTIIRSPIVRHDAPQSCRAAFTIDELRSMAAHAGLRGFEIKSHHGPFRMVLAGRK